ncbi:MAG: hypothetical protein HZA79_16680 [Sphingobacteriales bacterium]|nr:hypothetical protein [Sphingobacteriales bacterium]
MNNVYTMSASLEAQYRSRAALITGVFTVLFILLMFLLKWKLPVFEKTVEFTGIEVELNLPPDPPVPFQDGGGGGGNPVQASGAPGIAQAAPLPPGTNEPSQEVKETDDNSNSPAITKPVAITKPTATKITNTSVTKTEPKVIENPAPPRPKAVLGKTTTGTGRGGGAAENYDRSGGTGTGTGVGNGSGVGGGNGSGVGGGNGSGAGTGSGPRVTRGDRKIVRSYSFEGDLEKATIYANVNVSPDGSGSFVSIAKGSTQSSAAYKEAIMRYLRNIRFDKADHESMITVQFNFRVN